MKLLQENAHGVLAIGRCSTNFTPRYQILTRAVGRLDRPIRSETERVLKQCHSQISETPADRRGAVLLVPLALPGAKLPLPKALIRQIKRREDVYVGYYESGEGHPLVFTRSRFGENAWLYHGGRDWQRIQVVEGVVRQNILTKAERAWVATCWLASSRQRDRRSRHGSGSRRRSA